MLTVVIPSFYSSKLIEERILEINKEIPIIIIENSKDLEFKKKIESKFKNVKVIIPDENLGFGKAVNIGIKESKTNMVFLSQPDVKLIDNCINKLIECIQDFKDFSLLAPYDKNNEFFNNYEVYKSYEEVEAENKFLLEEVDFVDLTWLINKEKFDNDEFWDENIFLYFEAQDFSKRLKDKNKKIFISKAINTYHIGASSHDKRLDSYSKLNRNWHYNWSRFYYNKKHFGIFYAYRKGLPLIIKLFLRFLKSIILFETKERKFIFAELHGLLASMTNRSSYYRPYRNAKLND
jgi:GT2 family glycosyltransferase